MDDRHPNDPIYSAIVIGALVGFVALGVLGLPTLLLALATVAIGAVAIFGLAVRDAPNQRRRPTRRRAIPGGTHYVPHVLEAGASRARRRRFGPRRRGTRPSRSLPHL